MLNTYISAGVIAYVTRIYVDPTPASLSNDDAQSRRHPQMTLLDCGRGLETLAARLDLWSRRDEMT